MKLLYITNGIIGAGGLERVLSVKASALAEDFGYEVHILTLNELGRKPFYNFSSKVNFHTIEVGGNFLSYLKSYRNGILSKISEIKPDVISVCDDGLKGFFIPRMIGKKIPVIYERHASVDILKNDSKSHFKLKFQHALMNFLGSDFRKFIVLTKGNVKEWNLNNVQVIENPLSFKGENSSTHKNKRIISVGSHSYNKGTDLLLQVWQKVQESFPDWELDVYGKSDNGKYEALAKDLNLKNINFHKPYDKIEEKYLDASISVLTSRSEGFGMVLIEAMSCGLPVVSFNCPHGPADIITDGEDGFLIENGNTKQFAQQLMLLMNNYDLRKKMGVAGKQKVKKYLPENIVKQWDELFKSFFKSEV